MARTKPLPRSERILRGREINRGIERTRKTDDVKNINIGLMDCLAGGKPDRARAAGPGRGNEGITCSDCRLLRPLEYKNVRAVHQITAAAVRGES